MKHVDPLIAPVKNYSAVDPRNHGTPKHRATQAPFGLGCCVAGLHFRLCFNPFSVSKVHVGKEAEHVSKYRQAAWVLVDACCSFFV